MTGTELAEAGFAVDEGAYTRLRDFVRLLLEANRTLNLTALRTEDQVWRSHVCDALALRLVMTAGRAVRVVDVGTGGGVPGIPIACACPEADVTLMDATRKKISTVRRIVADLGLPNVRVLAGRAEHLAHDPALREQFDVATARAVAALPLLVEYVAGFVRPGGEAWLYKSAVGVNEEAAAARAAAAACALVPSGLRAYRLPGEKSDRFLVGYAKIGKLADGLPRDPTRARKRPLG